MKPPQITATLKKMVQEAMLKGAPAIVNGIQQDGKVLINGGWTTYQQGCALLLAELFCAEDTPYYQSAEVMDKLARSFDYFANMTDEEGKTPLTTVFGTWGIERNLPGWEYSGFVWLYRFHKGILPPRTLATLEAVISKISNTLTRELPSERLHNIPTWNASALWCAGNEFNRDEWKRSAAAYLERILEAQKPDGYWFEHTGPTTKYNLVYVHALGLHLFDGGEVDAAGALDRAGAFHSRFVYPDGTHVSVVDGRVLYHWGKSVLGLPGLLQSESGLDYCRALAESEKPFGPPNGNGVNFVPQVYRFLCSQPVIKVPEGHGPVPLAGKTSRHSRGDFTLFLSGILGTDENRWGYDRLQYVEVHHPNAGVILGGGLSRGQEMAFLSSGGDYLPRKASLDSKGRVLRLEYPWGRAVISPASSARPAIDIEVQSDRPVKMLLPLVRTWVEAGTVPDTPSKVTRLSAKGITLSVEPAAQLAFPLKPWYPYHKEGEAPEDFWRYGLVWQTAGGLKAGLRFEDQST